MGTQAPSTLPRGGSMLHGFTAAPPPVPADRGKNLPGAGKYITYAEYHVLKII